MYPFILIVPYHLSTHLIYFILFLTNKIHLLFTTTFIYNVHLPHLTPTPPPLGFIRYFLRGNCCRMAIKVNLPVCHLSLPNSFDKVTDEQDRY
jgi:hypothetical protein